ncbi:ankyrin repeat-containing domain protein [Coprinopsis sp. MPI-PUGE-AT-0042]|nr:ankyrin repeat-containing domain protein [Coprinopsis sp. MPI-PUGE-AT-0042]
MTGRDSINTTIHNHISTFQIGAVDVLEILNSIPLPNFRDIQQDILAKATEGTCLWFIANESFLIWIEKGMILWGIGIPGAGKTVLAAIVLRHLKGLEVTARGTICVAYVYLRYSEPLTIRDILECLVKQIVERHADVIPLAEGLYSRHQRERTKASQQDLIGLLAQMANMGKTFFVLDALDELRAEDRPVLIRFLVSLEARLFVTSRPLDSLRRRFPQAQFVDLAARPSDIDIHIREFLSRNPDLLESLEGSDYVQIIIETIRRKSGGMFLHANLQLEALRHCLSIQAAEEALECFPSDIEEVYSQTWKRILNQGPHHAGLAKLVFLWILHADGEMSIEELRHVIATSPTTYRHEPKRMVSEGALVSACCGLYYTAKECLLPFLLELYPCPHAIPAQVCLAHLTHCGLQDASYGSLGILEETLAKDPLLAYAYRGWAHHAHPARQTEAVATDLANFLRSCRRYPTEFYQILDYLTPLHVAAAHGFVGSISPTTGLPVQSPNARTPIFKLTPLHVACASGRRSCVEALLSLASIDVNVPDGDGLTALMTSILEGNKDAARLLLRVPEIDVSMEDDGGWTAVLHACGQGHTHIVRLLLKIPGVDVNAATLHGLTPLMWASAKGRTETVRVLLQVSDIDFNAVDSDGWTALIHASAEGRTDVVRLLLTVEGLDINTATGFGFTVLKVASEKGYTEIVRLFLKMPDIEVSDALGKEGGDFQVPLGAWAMWGTCSIDN